MTTPSEDHATRHQATLRTDLVRGSLWTLLGSVVSIPITLVANLVIVRALGPGEFARLALFTAAFSIALTVANLGVTVATSQELALARARNDRERAVRLIRACSGFFLLFETPVLVVVVVIALRDASATVITLGVVACVAAAVLATSLVTLSGSGRNARAAQATLLMTVLGQAGTAVVAALSGSADVTWVARLASMIIAPLAAVGMLEPDDRRALFRPALRMGLGRGFRSTALAFWALAVTAALLLDRTEIFVLQWSGHTLAVAVFALATTIAGQLTGPMDSLMGPLAPTSAGLIAADPRNGPTLLDSTLAVSAMTGALTAAIMLPALVVLVPPVFGPAYGHAVTVLVVLGVVSCLDSALTPVRALAFGARAAPGVLAVTIISLVADVGLAIGLIPPFGLAGAVIALCTGQIVFALLLVRLVCRRLGVTPGRVYRRCGAALVGAALAVVALGVSAPVGVPVVRAVVAAAIGVLLLATVLRTVPGLRLPAADLDRIVALLPGRTGRVLGRMCRLFGLAAATAPARH